MPPTLLSGKEALVQGSVSLPGVPGGAEAAFFAAPSFSAHGPDPALLDRIRAEGGFASESEDLEAALAGALDAASSGRLGVAALGGRDIAAAERFFAIARSTREKPRRVLFLVLGGPGRGPEGDEGASHAELAPLRWAGGEALSLLVPTSPAECYALARDAARSAGQGPRPTALYVDHVVAHLRESVETDAPGSESPENIGDVYRLRDAEILVVAAGIVGRAALTAVRAAREQGIRAGLYRLLQLWGAHGSASGWHASVAAMAARARRVIVPELSEGQVWEPVAAALQRFEPRSVTPLWPGARGGRVSPERILAEIAAIESGGNRPGDTPPQIARRGMAIRLAGDPAHGLLFTGYVLAEAAMIDRRAVSHLPSLGATARGPLSGGALRVGGEPDEDPVVVSSGCLVVTSREALARYAGELAPEGRLIAEESLPGLPESAIGLPLVRTAIEAGGTAMVVDLVAAAVVTEMTGAVSRRALQEAADRLLPARGRPAALAALDAGMELGKRLLRA